MPNQALWGLIVVLSSAFLGGLLSQKIHQPAMFGYLIAGLAVSGWLEKFGLERGTLNLLAEIGLAFLMFTLGLEFSLDKIKKIRKVALGGGLAQIILSTIIIFPILSVFHLPLKAALMMAASFSLSSTAIVVKLLQEKNRLESLPGEIMESWLLIQDLAVLPLMALLPVIFGQTGTEANLFFLLKAVTILLLAWISASKTLPRFFDFISSFKSRELLLILSVCLVLILAVFTASLGFSFALGAFLAGMILSQSSSNMAIFSEIRPLRDVFLAIFFVSLGLSLRPSFIGGHLIIIVLISLVVLSLKFLVTIGILVYFKYHAKTISMVAFGLAQVGEFAFVLAAAAFADHFISEEIYSLIVSVTLLTVVLTPWLFWGEEKIYPLMAKLARHSRFYQRFFAEADRLPIEEVPLENHVVILGFGRVGHWVGNLLEKVKIPYLVVEYDPHLVRRLKLEGKKVVFGDPTDLAVLDFAQVEKAKLVVIAIPDSLTQKMAIVNCKTLNPDVEIICRSHLEDDLLFLKNLGVGQVIQPEFEAALSMGHRILQYFGWKNEEISFKIKEIKIEHLNQSGNVSL